LELTNPEPSNADRWFSPGRFAALLGVVLVLAFNRVLLGGESFYFRDFGIFGYPLAWYHRDSFWRGEVPLWNPYNGMGLPHLAQWNTLALYPGTLVYLLLPLPWSLNVFCLAHLFLAGLGMYFLALRWTGNRFAAAVAGLAFALNGLLLSSLKWPNNIAVLGWTPWVVWLVERAWERGGRMLVVAGLAGACQMLAGTPELILLTWMVLAGMWVGAVWLRWRHRREGAQCWRSVLVRFPLVVLLVAGLAAAQLAPFLEFMGHSQRSARFGVESWAMPAWGWANLLVPLFHCFRSHQGVFAQYDQYWISSYYVSLPVVVLALWALGWARRRRVWLAGGVLLTSLVLALGHAGGLYALLLRVCPPLGFMRFPIKFVVPAVLALPLLAACAIAHWERLRHERGRGPACTLGAVLLGVLAGIGVILVLARLDPMPADSWAATVQNGLRRAGFLLLAAAFWYGREEPKWGAGRGWLGLAVCLTIASDGLTHAPWQNPTVPRWLMAPGLPELQPPPTLGRSRAMLSPAAEEQLDHWTPGDPTQDYLASRMGLFCNCNLIDGIPKVDGFYSLYPGDTGLILGLLYRSNNAAYPALAGFLGVSQITSEGKMASWTPQTNHLPLVTGGQAPAFADRGATLRALASPELDLRKTLYLPLEAKGQVTVTNAAVVRIGHERWTAHRVEVEADAQRPGWVVIAQSFYPRWQARVNGRPARVWRANLAFQAVEVPAGRNRLELAYHDTGFRAGAVVSLLALVTCGLAWRRLGNPANGGGPSPTGGAAT
jgi:hypothetical protein